MGSFVFGTIVVRKNMNVCVCISVYVCIRLKVDFSHFFGQFNLRALCLLFDCLLSVMYSMQCLSAALLAC